MIISKRELRTILTVLEAKGCILLEETLDKCINTMKGYATMH